MKTTLTLLSLLTAGIFTVSAFAAPAPLSGKQAPGYYRMMLGDWQITAVSDGTVVVPLDKLLTNISPQRLGERLAQEAMKPAAETSINTFVINTGRQLILVDTGAGPLLGKAGGHLLDNLRAAGFPPEKIDLVLLTHIHGDHSGGVQLDGKPAFPNAKVRVEQKDIDWWLNPRNIDKVESSQRHTFAESERSMRPVISAGKLQAFNAPAVIMPGIEALPTGGHTPGSVVYRVSNGGQSMLFWGDIIHAKAVQLPDPKVAIHFDVDQKQAVATRERILKQVAKEGDWVAAAHIAFPGIGHVFAQGNGYRWVPVNYSSVADR